MMSMCMFVLLLMFSCVLSYIFLNSSIISMLICLEVLMLFGLTLFMYMSTSMMVSSYWFMVIISFSVTEAAMGLSVFVMAVRVSGSDLVKSLSLH